MHQFSDELIDNLMNLHLIMTPCQQAEACLTGILKIPDNTFIQLDEDTYMLHETKISLIKDFEKLPTLRELFFMSTMLLAVEKQKYDGPLPFDHHEVRQYILSAKLLMERQEGLDHFFGDMPDDDKTQSIEKYKSYLKWVKMWTDYKKTNSGE